MHCALKTPIGNSLGMSENGAAVRCIVGNACSTTSNCCKNFKFRTEKRFWRKKKKTQKHERKHERVEFHIVHWQARFWLSKDWYEWPKFHMSPFNISRFIFYSAALLPLFSTRAIFVLSLYVCCCRFLHCFKVENFFVIITLRASWWRKHCAPHTIPVVYRVSVWYDLFFIRFHSNSRCDSTIVD